MSIRPLLAALALTLAACQSTEPVEPQEMDWDAAMASFLEMGTPGAGHAAMQPMIGSFAATTTVFMPDGSTDVSNASCRNEWALDGRFMETHFDGLMMGQPFTGRGFFGYDNAAGEYVGMWLDSMVTAMPPVSRGSISDDGRVITMYRSMVSPMTGQMETMREVMTIHSDDHHTFDMFVTPEGGEEMPSLHIDYVRL